MLNDFQQNMFDQAEALVSSGDAFFRQEFVLDGTVYWIYNYRLASYTEFERPGGREMRGHMFEVKDGKPVRLAALPMQKFHNLNECPLTMDLDLTQVDRIEYKADGSMISTYMHGSELRLKSKGSLSSDQANDAMAWLNRSENKYFKQLLWDFTVNGTTVNLEWISPNNRIVIGYMESALKVLNARNMDTGEFVDTWIFANFNIAAVDTNGLNPVEFVAQVPAMLDDIEGFVVKLKNGLWFKIKTEKYMSLHHAKDSVNNPRRLFECIVDEAVDDLRSMFATDQLAMKMIDEMSEKVAKLFNHMVATVENFYEANKHLERKFYAIKGRDENELDQLYFGLVMNKYIGRPVDYKEFAKSKYREFGFKDETVDV
jgi:RNA ligase